MCVCEYMTFTYHILLWLEIIKTWLSLTGYYFKWNIIIWITFSVENSINFWMRFIVSLVVIHIHINKLWVWIVLSIITGPKIKFDIKLWMGSSEDWTLVIGYAEIENAIRIVWCLSRINAHLKFLPSAWSFFQNVIWVFIAFNN